MTMPISRSAAEAELQKAFANVDDGMTAKGFEETVLDNGRRVSTPLAMKLLSQMGLGNDTDKPFQLFENACGPGVVAPALQQLIRPDVLKQSSILCGDFSEPLVTIAKNRKENEGWLNTEVRKIDAQVRSLSAFSLLVANGLLARKPSLLAALSLTWRRVSPSTLCPTRRLLWTVRDSKSDKPDDANERSQRQSASWSRGASLAAQLGTGKQAGLPT